jgi:Domain of unknown function (DUF4440)
MPTRKAEAEWKDNIAEGSGRLNGDEVLRIHKEVFYGALKSQNYTALEELYMLVRSDGSVLNKQEVLQELRTNGLTFHSIELRESTVRIYGPTAVLTGESRSP